MSFTSTVKQEISKINNDVIASRSELSAILINNSTISNNIVLTTENIYNAERIVKLLKEIYDINPQITVRKGYNFNKNFLYIITIINKVSLIINDLTLNDNIPKEYLYIDNDLAFSYLRGLFMSVGSINDPKKSRYHLEFLVENIEFANFISKLLNKFYLNSKIVKRNKKYMIYIKEAEKIGDFLRMIGASNALFYYEDIRIFRDHMNMTNRLNNCEQANIEKSILASNKEIDNIKYLKEKDVYDLLLEKEKIVAEYRLKYPDVSLLELSKIISLETNKNITKSGIYHRLKKIEEFTNKIRNKEKINV